MARIAQLPTLNSSLGFIHDFYTQLSWLLFDTLDFQTNPIERLRKSIGSLGRRCQCIRVHTCSTHELHLVQRIYYIKFYSAGLSDESCNIACISRCTRTHNWRNSNQTNAKLRTSYVITEPSEICFVSVTAVSIG